MSMVSRERDVFYRLVASLTLCDDMSDVADAIAEALDQIGDSIQFDNFAELREALAKRGVVTLFDMRLDE
jgi:hypothetical protein